MKLVSLFCSISMNMNTFWKKFKFTVVAAVMLISRERKKWIQITTLIASLRARWCLLLCLFRPSFTCHVSRRWSSWGGHLTKKLNAWKALCNQEASFNSLSLVSIHYNESQANLRVDDDDVHFQRWLLELLVLQLSASISPMIMAAIKYSCGR